MPKTGSTSIQAALNDNLELLENRGWSYPLFSCPQSGHVFFNHNDPLCRLFFEEHPFHVQRDVQNGVIDLAKQQEGLSRQLDRCCRNAQQLVLSSEVLMEPASLKRIQEYMNARGYEVEPIVYIRSPYTYRVSLYQSFLKFSQLPASIIAERLQEPFVQRAVQIPMEVFGNTVKFYPFNNLVRVGTDVVRHFFAHILDDAESAIPAKKEDNPSLSRQAVALLAHIEEQSPLYAGNEQNEKREPGDISPLHQITGERFGFDPGLAAMCRETVDWENKWLREHMGGEYCDGEYMNAVVTAPLVWDGESARSLLRVFPLLSLHLKTLVFSYLKNSAAYSAPVTGRATVSEARRLLLLARLKSLFPPGTRRGRLARMALGQNKATN